MSHVDEGMLHAYLDGALDSFPTTQAEQVRRHLAECDVCRARLDEEKALRDEASAILGGASLDVGDMPSFEELRARAHAPRSAVAGSRMERLAWAATVVLALGTGWFLRGGIPQPGGAIDALEDRADGAAAPAVSEPGPGEAADATGVDAPPVSVERVTPPPARTGGSAGAQGVSSPQAPVLRDAQVAEVEVAAKAADPLMNPGAVEPRPEQARRVVNLAGSAVPFREDMADAGASLVVPGLSVVSVTWLDEAGLAGAVRVLQLMEGGDTLELVHLPAGVDPSLLPAKGDGRTQVLAPRDGGWLVLRGRTSADVLSGLLRRMGGGD